MNKLVPSSSPSGQLLDGWNWPESDAEVVVVEVEATVDQMLGVELSELRAVDDESELSHRGGELGEIGEEILSGGASVMGSSTAGEGRGRVTTLTTASGASIMTSSTGSTASGASTMTSSTGSCHGLDPEVNRALIGRRLGRLLLMISKSKEIGLGVWRKKSALVDEALNAVETRAVCSGEESRIALHSLMIFLSRRSSATI